MSELYERLQKYRKKGKQYEKQEVSAFRLAILNELYPQKCLACFEAGLRWCKYWKTKFNCEEYEKGETEQIFKEFS